MLTWKDLEESGWIVDTERGGHFRACVSVGLLLLHKGVAIGSAQGYGATFTEALEDATIDANRWIARQPPLELARWMPAHMLLR